MFTEEYTQILQRYIILCQLFGLAPLTKSHLSFNFHISKTRFLISVLYRLIQVVHAIYHVWKIYDKIHMTTMSDIIHFVWMFQCLLTSILTTTQTLFIPKNLMRYLNELCDIDKDIHSKLQIIPNYKRQNRKHLCIMIFIIVTSLLMSWTLYGSLAFLYPELITLFAFNYLPAGFMSIRVFQLIHLIELLNDHLDIINHRLRSLIKANDGGNTDNIISKDLVSLRQLFGRCWNALQLYNGYSGFSNLMLLLFYSYDVMHGVYSLFLNMYGLRPDLVALCKY